MEDFEGALNGELALEMRGLDQSG